MTAAVVERGVVVRGSDIYGQGVGARGIWIVGGLAQPGNSGGPLVDGDGRVLGVVYASSDSRREQAYALTNEEVSADIAASLDRTTALDTRAFGCAS